MPQADSQHPRIFICYRRGDSGGHAHYLFERLNSHFGDGQVFMDLEQIEPGEDFVQVIEEAVGACEILLALIGPHWLAGRDGTERRLDDTADFVRLELAAALARGVSVIPVLVQGAQMPHPHDLPEDIRPLTRRQAFEFGDRRWRPDADRLIERLDRVLARRREEREEEGRREAEARRRADEEERLRRATAEQERLRREAEETGRARLEAEERGPIPTPDARAPAPPELKPAPVNTPPAAQAVAGAEPAPAIRRSKRSCTVVLIYAAALALLLTGLTTWYRLWPKRISGPPQTPTPTPVATPHEPQAPAGMVYVPGGVFLMGDNAGDEFERPAHAVAVRDFFIDQYEVTNEEYAKFIKETGHPPPPTWKGGMYAEGEARRPVTGVTWADANAYARWAGKRLPAEEEWEYVARGADGRHYPWGNEWRAGLANVDRPSGGLVDVGRYPDGKSPFGAFDMIGNAWEWTGSSLTPYRRGEEVGTLPKGIPDNAMVIRGGSFATPRARATATYRGYRGMQSPGDRKLGFRCVREADAGPVR